MHLRAAVSVLGRFPALAGVDLDVAAGEIVHLAGPNGAGKSTLLRVCAALARVSSGEAVVLGHDVTSDQRSMRRSLRRQVGLLGHQTFLYDDLTVQENVRFWARAARAADGQVDAALERLGLGGRLRDVPVSRLSAGQRRRTSLAAMLSRRPRLWLLDEPHAGLDQEARDIVDGLIRDAVEAGATVMIASHEHERLEGLESRSVTLVGGVVTDDSGAASEPTGIDSTGADTTAADTTGADSTAADTEVVARAE